MILDINELACEVPGRELFRGLTLVIGEGESVAVVGPSGSGKSTLLSTILGMNQPRSGSIHVCGLQVDGLGPTKSAAIRREHIGVVFQDGELLPELTAAENIAVALMMNQPHKYASRMDEARDMLSGVGVPTDTRAEDLSGGERQRTAMMRALSTNPELVIADEPTGSLDTQTRDEVADLLFDTIRERGGALLVVTHDPTIADREDRRIDLRDYVVAPS
ncbi:MAG: ABC transporter ATP-binding protein [Ancrocorticia sp.]|uniref:ABC transporter ATP-binding protein n=1 Tax=Ancrocorticia sp. TaxID=2593684 RepID=UPI003F91859C